MIPANSDSAGHSVIHSQVKVASIESASLSAVAVSRSLPWPHHPHECVPWPDRISVTVGHGLRQAVPAVKIVTTVSPPTVRLRDSGYCTNNIVCTASVQWYNLN